MQTHIPIVSLWQTDLPDDVASALHREVDGVAIDIETTGLDWQSDSIATVQLATSDGIVHIVRVTKTPMRLTRLLGDAGVRKVLHHAMFDLRFMAQAWGTPIANVSCTKVASKLLEPEAKKHSLKELLLCHLGIEIDKGQQKSNWLAEGLSKDQLAYAASDVLHLHRLLSVLTQKLDISGRLALAEGCFAHIPTRVALEVGGYPDVFTY